MTLFLGISLISTVILFEDLKRDSFEITSSTTISTMSSRFENINKELIDLDKQGYSKSVFERILPFTYDLNKDGNSLTLTQTLPLSQSKLKTFFDSMNLARVFFTDTNRSHTFDGFIANVSVPKNTDWSGSATSASFLINPFCYKYEAQITGNTLFKKETSSKCTNIFSQSYLKRIDINIFVNDSDDYNSLLCNNTSCPQNAFNPASAQPYYNITIIDSNCPSCSLGGKTAMSHFNPSSDFNVVLSCTGANCTSGAILIKESSLDLNISHDSGRLVSVLTKITFNNPIESFFVEDVNLVVYSPTTGFEKSTK
jgi:hypothetical protein